MSKRHLLVVEDDVMVRELLVEILDREFTVHAAASVEEARAIARRVALTVVLSDIKMPREDGFVMLQFMADEYPNVPVVLLTGHADKKIAIQAVRGHAFDLLEKPCDLEEILLTCRRAAQHHVALAQRELLLQRVNTLTAKIAK